MKYSITMRRTRIVLEEVKIVLEADSPEQAVQDAFGSSHQDWSEIAKEQVLIGLADQDNLKHKNFIQETAKEIVREKL
ncbi:conserved hypothetical protein [Burkholderia cenocepacia]|uniref:hypothetical protein n=1 Tax=Burkholderia cenocepacia TaxID=95486 RepID=UPI00192AABDA|nr:hypothetical protein [Burkholderia cenocepacia]CAD9228062.1 conserved hypothetical protein [Burkholderia cenocepacia]